MQGSDALPCLREWSRGSGHPLRRSEVKEPPLQGGASRPRKGPTLLCAHERTKFTPQMSPARPPGFPGVVLSFKGGGIPLRGAGPVPGAGRGWSGVGGETRGDGRRAESSAGRRIP